MGNTPYMLKITVDLHVQLLLIFNSNHPCCIKTKINNNSTYMDLYNLHTSGVAAALPGSYIGIKFFEKK